MGETTGRMEVTQKDPAQTLHLEVEGPVQERKLAWPLELSLALFSSVYCLGLFVDGQLHDNAPVRRGHQQVTGWALYDGTSKSLRISQAKLYSPIKFNGYYP